MPLAIGKVRVDVSLCGAVPRSCPTLRSLPLDGSHPKTPRPISAQKIRPATSRSLSPIREVGSNFASVLRANGLNSPTEGNRSKSDPTATFSGESLFSNTDSFDTVPPSDHFPRTSSQDSMQLPLIEPPHWAVPANGESRLEPVCEALGSHGAIDLTDKSCYRVGRSPGSDLQLLHNTSSRRHALIVHHPNGGCYIVDCGSSHGTYVNGVRVRSTPAGSMVIPHRVRRGSLIRFGGPGAPTFVLKSFSIGFSSMVKELNTPTESPFSEHRKSQEVKDSAFTLPPPQEGGILRKRSFDSGTAEPEAKRQRCISPSSSMLETGPIRLVSPESPRRSKRVSFHDETQAIYPVLVTPDVLSSDEEDIKL